jgi:hypothetical protein
MVLIRVRRYLYMYYTPETLLNHVFEDLWKTKAPNTFVYVPPPPPGKTSAKYIIMDDGQRICEENK